MEVTPDVKRDESRQLSRPPFGELTPAKLTADSARRSEAHGVGPSLQRFSLKSRRSTPYPDVPMKPGSECLRPTNRLERSGEYGSALVKLCSCSWLGPLDPTQKRLCQHDTDEHDEYRLLEAMSRNYKAERHSQGEPEEPWVASAWEWSRIIEGKAATELATLGDKSDPKMAALAASQTLEVHFILEPKQQVVVGYIALRKAEDGSTSDKDQRHASSATYLLCQVYVEPECRHLGYATTALKVIFANAATVTLASPTAAASDLMARVGFTKSSQDTTSGSGLINFARVPPVFDQEDRL